MNPSGDQPYRSPSSAPETPVGEATLTRTNVLLMFLLAFGTFGLYTPIWFLRRRKALNQLGGELSAWPFVLVLVLLFPLNYLTLASVDAGGRALAGALQLVVGIVILVMSFSVKNVLENCYPQDEGIREMITSYCLLENAGAPPKKR